MLCAGRGSLAISPGSGLVNVWALYRAVHSAITAQVHNMLQRW